MLVYLLFNYKLVCNVWANTSNQAIGWVHSFSSIAVRMLNYINYMLKQRQGHSHRQVPLTTGVDLYPRVLPFAYCVPRV